MALVQSAEIADSLSATPARRVAARSARQRVQFGLGTIGFSSATTGWGNSLVKPAEIIELFLLGLTMVGTCATAIIILTQARLLRLQNQLQALIQLNEAWESVRMNGLRARWAANDRDLESAEEILEFLEEFAGLRARHVLDNALVWDSTIGWHATRYYFYNRENGNIGRLRAKWLDETLYRNLDVMWRRYVRIEQKERADIDEKNLEQQIIETRGKFLTAEQARDANRISDGVN